MRVGEEASLDVTGAPMGATLHIVRSLSGLGESVCPDVMDGACLGLAPRVRRHVSGVAGADGELSNVFTVPDRLALTPCFQAVILSPELTLSAPICGTISEASAGEDLPDIPFFGWAEDPQPDGTFDLSWDLWWGQPGDEAQLREDGALVASQEVAAPATTPGSQSGIFELIDRTPGEHTYVVSLCNGAGCTDSSPLSLTILEAVTTDPTEPGTTTPPVTDEGGWVPTETLEGPSHDKRVIGYFTEWGIYGRDYLVADIPADQLTHIHYAFGMIMGDDFGLVGSPYRCLPPPSSVPGSYELAVCDPWATLEITSFARSVGPLPTWEASTSGQAGNLQQLRNLKALYPHLTSLISVGGWSLSGDFSAMAADPDLRGAFVASAISFIDTHGFDGIDLDWEYPVVGGESDSAGVAADADNLLLLLRELREALGPDRPLAMALGAGPAALEALDLSAVVDELTYVTLMTYDFHGAWEVGTVTAHQAGLYDNADPIDGDYNMDSAVQTLLEAGVPADKIVPGLPFYGRSFAGVSGGDNGFGAPFSGAGPGSFEGGILDYRDIAENYTEDEGYTRYWDDTAKAPWLYNPTSGIYISYDDACAIGHKVAYANSYGLGGVMFWETSGDDGVLLGTVDEQLTTPTSAPCGAEG
jgi:chitinase